MKVKGHCQICATPIELQICCNAFDCGCGGKPQEPPVCSEECYNEYMKPPDPLDIDDLVPGADTLPDMPF